MFQLPLLGSGMPGMVKGSGPDSAGGSGLEGLLPGADGLMAGFSGELQAMLMQMSPQMLQQLEDLLAGGMTLPQAAKSLLAEAGYAGTGIDFDSFLEEGLPALQEQSNADQRLQRSTGDGGLGRLAENLLARSAQNFPNLSDALSAPIAAAIQAPGQNPLGGPLPPQLAASLLDMGVPQQVAGKGWDGAIADRVMWMVQGEQQFAKLQLNPPNLGPLEVRISVHQDQTSVSFIAQHAAVREALEAALPRLREMFDQQSLQLVRADISDPGAQQGGGAHDPSARPPSGHGLWGDGSDEGEGAAEADVRTRSGAADNLVDLFA